MNTGWTVGPSHVDFNVTNGCNLACSHCHSSSGDKLPEELSTDEAVEVLNQLHAMGVLRLAIAGGEPFMRRDILQILEHACSLPGWQVSVITNGLFFRSKGRIEELADRCPGLSVNVSLDGSTPTRFHVLRKQAHRPNDDPTPMFAQVTQGIAGLVAAGVHTSVNVTLSRPTLDDCLPTYRLVVDELGASALVGIKFFPGGYGKAIRDRLEIPYPTWAAAFADLTIEKLAGRYPALQVSVPAAWEFYLPLIQAGIDIPDAERTWRYRSPLREQGYRASHSIADTTARAELSIAGDGTVYPSVLTVGVAELAAGNARGGQLHEIWATSSILTQLRTLEVDDLEADCRHCSLVGVCGGGSRARAYSGAGSIAAADYACPLINPAAMDVQRPDHQSPTTSNPIWLDLPTVKGGKDFEMPSEAWKSVSTAQPKMRVLGHGQHAARVFVGEDGRGEVRANGHIVACDDREAHLLYALAAAPTAIAAIDSARALGLTEAESISLLTELMRLLEQLGVSASATHHLSRIQETLVVSGGQPT